MRGHHDAAGVGLSALRDRAQSLWSPFRVRRRKFPRSHHNDAAFRRPTTDRVFFTDDEWLEDLSVSRPEAHLIGIEALISPLESPGRRIT